MKKVLAILLPAVMIMTAAACNSTPDAPAIKLVNRMTATELSRADKHGLTLLDEPEITDPVAEFDRQDHKIEFMFQERTPDDLKKELESHRSRMTDDQYNEALKYIDQNPEGITYPCNCFFDGYILFDMIPLMYSYDGGEVVFEQGQTNDDGSTGETKTISLSGPEEYYSWIKDKHTGDGESEAKATIAAAKVRLAYEALLSGNYEKIAYRDIDYSDPSIWETDTEDKSVDYRSEWEYERDEVASMKDSVDEYSIYDEEMDTEFLIHAVLPPSYDPSKTYPVIFLTDGVYRFGNTPAMRKAMENGEASDAILVTLGYNYHMNGREEVNRFDHMVLDRAKLLDFITDNVMPYLGENYNIDYASSTLYGHSDGGVFTHYALFNSDKYENQPFGRYIIGSPAFFALYDDPKELDLAGYQSDYGYWDRNGKLDKKVFLCGGSQEDPDYADLYHGNETILEGLASLNERLKSHGADVVYKLYESHHYQYIPDMLVEFLKEYYPVS